ncbi:exodeoxyribonuclease VII small subunit [Virgibacillus halodenitrificans]|jgi:exodeoxyribonuclease VII small subunit|uniref:Exodeoxyribonuclease 7 small subunit n=1 Tax=Virgibacillus halodenitrificans TaxID=1482 RepID=A0AAC9NKX0_VIRHA|nr:exodeoxyribonuclease VII small subunit [Virgibacillus halodenitrificans]APC48340.1 exodeoxyribonuclease VII small subunit [Virgibacillus halodenitrificans]MBD1222711.1 exodeoxyribonuclease VII small subunit [Virgibacillus halodenitrificans]MCG1029880.1 exodeoxyribonuclease VII small subunit [Virgibacillus halodenitrificans]MCJ0930905.1 exodeoxyribonuclease VII small subunit [Virgibacillus halodenitrificans]MEC2158392.1 exodeoxyribonuclease VII small subunit [Virgibacillus halodenitrificans]
MEENNELSFEEAMKELEKIVGKLEEGDVPLERAIDYYQEGMKLSKLCNDKLKNVQEKMTNIMNEQGDLEPFEIQEDE